MFGKLFKSAYSGSMVGSGPVLYSVWGYVLAHTVEAQVELHPSILSVVIGTPVEEIEAAIVKLCSPDPRSRSKSEEGRRLVKEGEFAYRVVNWATYRDIANEEQRREYNRLKKREERQMSATVSNCQSPSAMSAQVDVEVESEVKVEVDTEEEVNVRPKSPPDPVPNPVPRTVRGRDYVRDPKGEPEWKKRQPDAHALGKAKEFPRLWKGCEGLFTNLAKFKPDALLDLVGQFQMQERQNPGGIENPRAWAKQVLRSSGILDKMQPR